MPNLLLDSVSVSQPNPPVALLMDNLSVSVQPPVPLLMDNVAVSLPPAVELFMDIVTVTGTRSLVGLFMDSISVSAAGVTPPLPTAGSEGEEVLPVAPDPPAFLVGQDKGG